MNLCSNYHEEIAHEGRKCPICEIIKEKDQEIESLKDEVSDLKDHIDNQ